MSVGSIRFSGYIERLPNGFPPLPYLGDLAKDDKGEVHVWDGVTWISVEGDAVNIAYCIGAPQK